ncbi:MAG: hypothetical protein LIP02_08540 [Bacteroidales bacterium]|nr:hypothetical protein [Bacteroidales bacterium]
MRHTLNLYVGSAIAPAAVAAEGWGKGADGCFTSGTAQPSDEDLVAIEIHGHPDEGQRIASTSSAWADVLSQMRRRRLTIENPGDDSRLLLNVVTTSSEADMTLLEEIVRGATPDLYEIDIVVVTRQLAESALGAKYDNGSAAEMAQKLAQLRKDNSVVSHAIILDSVNSQGRSVTFDAASLGLLTARLAMLSSLAYNSIFPTTLDSDGRYPLLGLGLSTAVFDRRFFTDYLLRRVILSAMNREGVGSERVDVNWAVNRANEFINLANVELQGFWSEYVDSNKLEAASDNTIIENAAKRIEEIFAKVEKDFNDIIHDDGLTLADKRAFVAALINDDDPLLAGVQLDTRQNDIDALCAPQLEFFAQIDREGAEYQAKLENQVHHGTDEEAVEPEDCLLVTPRDGAQCDRLRELRNEIKASTRYMRRLQDEIDRQTQVLADDRRASALDNRRSRQLSDHVTDRPLERTFAPEPGREIPESVDLRQWFGPVEDQGEQNACTAFAVSSILEYTVNRGTGNLVDLSPAFLYWHTRNRSGASNTDSGASLYDAITTASERGVSLEALCPFSEEQFSKEPTQAANDDAADRRVTAAFNVGRDLKSIKAALASGYPVAVSLKVNKKMGANSAYIPTPNPDDPGLGFHAMVVVGYNDRGNIFIVRNSWGSDWADNGYCYMPYRYLANTSLLNAAYTITEVSGVNSQQATAPTRPATVSIKSTDAVIQNAVNCGLLEEEKVRLSDLQSRYGDVMRKHSTMVSQLSNERMIAQLVDRARAATAAQIDDYHNHLNKKQDERQAQLVALRREWKKNAFGGTVFTLVSLIVFAINLYFTQDNFWWPLIGVGVGVLMLVLCWTYYRHRCSCVRRDYDAEINLFTDRRTDLTRSTERLPLQANIAARILQSAYGFVNKAKRHYTSLRSFDSNLQQWGDTMQSSLSQMNPSLRAPLVAVASNQALDQYFDTHGQEIVEPIRLHPLLEQYEITDECISAIQDNVSSAVSQALDRRTADFSMLDYLLGDSAYPYLPPVDAPALMRQMIAMSYPLLEIRPGLGRGFDPNRIIFAAPSRNQRDRWRSLAASCSASQPTFIDLRPTPATTATITLLSLQPLSPSEIP